MLSYLHRLKPIQRCLPFFNPRSLPRYFSTHLIKYHEAHMDPQIRYGHYEIFQSPTSPSESSHSPITFHPISSLHGPIDTLPPTIWIRGHIHHVRIAKKYIFLVIRSQNETIQCTHHIHDYQSTPEGIQLFTNLSTFLQSLGQESIVDIYGTISSATIKSCTITTHEIKIQKIFCISHVPVGTLPFTIEDANRPEHIVEDSQNTSRPYPRIGQETRLDHRWLDLRTSSTQEIMKMKSSFVHALRNQFNTHRFTEIFTPKIIEGSNVNIRLH